MKHPFKSTIFGLGSTLLLLGSALFAPLAAHASADGRKNTTIALGAAAAYELLVRHQVAPALVLGAGAVYAGKRYEDALHHDRWNNNRDYHNNDYHNDNNHNDNDNYNDSRNRDNNNYSYSTNNNRDYERQGQRPYRDDYNQQGRSQDQQGRWNTQDSRQDHGQWRDDNDDNR